MKTVSLGQSARQSAQALILCSSGVAFIEFAVALPLLILLLFGVIEITRYIMIAQKLDRATETVGEVITANHFTNQLSGQYIPKLLNTIPIIMYPYTTGTNYVEYISDVYYPLSAGGPLVYWQCVGGSLGRASQIGTVGGTANLAGIPGGFSANPGEEFIITETYYQYTPITGMIPSLVGLPPLYRVGVGVPRGESLASGVILPGPQCTQVPPS